MKDGKTYCSNEAMQEIYESEDIETVLKGAHFAVDRILKLP